MKYYLTVECVHIIEYMTYIVQPSLWKVYLVSDIFHKGISNVASLSFKSDLLSQERHISNLDWLHFQVCLINCLIHCASPTATANTVDSIRKQYSLCSCAVKSFVLLSLRTSVSRYDHVVLCLNKTITIFPWKMLWNCCRSRYQSNSRGCLKIERFSLNKETLTSSK